MKAGDVFPPTRRSYFTIPEIDLSKADLGTFDPSIGGFKGNAAAPQGYRPATGMVHTGETSRPTTIQERQTMFPAEDQKLDNAATHMNQVHGGENVASLLQSIRQDAAAKRGQPQQAQAQVAAKAIEGQQSFAAPLGQGAYGGRGDSTSYSNPGPHDIHEEAAYHTIMSAHHGEMGNHERAAFHQSRANELIQQRGAAPDLTHFKRMAQASQPERSAGTQALQGMRQTRVAQMRRSQDALSMLKAAEAMLGGLADGKKKSDFDPKQLAAGVKVEREHTDSKKVAAEIAEDHLTEDKDYYKKLKTIEKSLSMLDDMFKAVAHEQFDLTDVGGKKAPAKKKKAPTPVKPSSEKVDVQVKVPKSKTKSSSPTPPAPSKPPAASSTGGFGGFSMSGTLSSAPKMAAGTSSPTAKPTSSSGPSPATRMASNTGGLPQAQPASPSTMPSSPTKNKVKAAAPPPLATATAGAGVLPPPKVGGGGGAQPPGGGQPPKQWSPTQGGATGANIVPKMTSTTGGEGTLHPGPQQAAAPAAGAGGGGKGKGKGAGGKQKASGKKGSAFMQGMAEGGQAASDISNPAGGAAPIQTLMGAGARAMDQSTWGSAMSGPRRKQSGGLSLQRSLQEPTDLIKSGPVLYIRAGARTFVSR